MQSCRKDTLRAQSAYAAAFISEYWILGVFVHNSGDNGSW